MLIMDASNPNLWLIRPGPPPPQFVFSGTVSELALLFFLGGIVWGPWVPGGIPSVWDAFGQGSLRSPKQIKIFVFCYRLENNFLPLCRANNPIIVNGWLNFGALVGYPLCAIVFCIFLIRILIKKLMLYVMATLQKLGLFRKCWQVFL